MNFCRCERIMTMERRTNAVSAVRMSLGRFEIPYIRRAGVSGTCIFLAAYDWPSSLKTGLS